MGLAGAPPPALGRPAPARIPQFALAMASRHHPIVAHIVPIRRCNLACAYCNEFDATSQPVPLSEMRKRVDLLAALGTTIITISGGEPMLHPDLDEIIRHIRKRRAITTLITNGYLLTVERIQRLNRAGLDYLQISIDNVSPDETSKKRTESRISAARDPACADVDVPRWSGEPRSEQNSIAASEGPPVSRHPPKRKSAAGPLGPRRYKEVGGSENGWISAWILYWNTTL